MPASKEFERWALGYAGCVGGDVGSPQFPSTWVCGIEWGGGHDPDGLRRQMQEGAHTPPSGYSSWKENINYIFNWQAMKLLAAMNGLPVKNYKQFAEDVKPFVDGAVGYFKMNLFPIAFRNTNHGNWLRDFARLTGFSSKREYLAWCNESRLPQLSRWARVHTPELIICLGKTFREEFDSAFSVAESAWTTETIDDRELSSAINEGGSLVVLLPFMVNRHGLVRNVSIQKFGERIAALKKANHRTRHQK